jgi:PAS domain S-box-containing protein
VALFSNQHDEQMKDPDPALNDPKPNQTISDSWLNILDSISESVYVQNREGRFLFVNKAVRELYGYHNDDLIGKTPDFLAAPGKNDMKKISKLIDEAYRGKPQKLQFWGMKKNGDIFLKDVSLTPGTFMGEKVVLAVSRDNTEKNILIEEKEKIISDLRASEDKYRSLSNMLRLMCDNVPDMIWAKDMNKRFLFANQAICNNLLNAGDTDEPIGKTDLFFAEREIKSKPENPEWHTFGEICRDSDQIVMESKKAQRFDEFGNVKGKFLFLDVFKAPFFDSNGKMIGTVGCGRDVTAERKLMDLHRQVEKELHEKTAQMNALISAMPDLLFVVNKDGVFTDFYAPENSMLLLPEEQIIGAKISDVVEEAEANRQLVYYRKCLNTGKPQSFRYTLENKNQLLHFEARISKIDPAHVLATVRDITASINMEKEIAWQQELQNMLMGLATQFINLPYGEIDLAVNKALEQTGRFTNSDRVYIFDYNFEKDIQINTYEWCSDGTTPEIENLQEVPNSLVPDWVKAHLQGKPTFVPRVSDLPKTDNLRQILEPQGIQSLITIPLMHEDRCLGYIGFDAVKHEKRWNENELALLRLFAQLLTNLKVKAGIEGELILAKERAEKSDKLKSAFMNNISHEVRTPLNSIIGFTDLVLNHDITDEEKRSYAEFLRQSSYRLIQTITDYMDSSIIVSGNQEVKATTVNAFYLLKDMHDQYAMMAGEKGIKLSVQVDENLKNLALKTDPELVKKTINHLLSNAVKFTLKGEITIGYYQEDHHLVFFVKDTGVGIGEEALPFVFDFFRQEDQSSIRLFEGSGLGLSIAKGLVKLLGGKIWLETKKGLGSTFFFSVPVNYAGETSGMIAERKEADKKPSRVILLVEDEVYNYKFMTALLTLNNYAQVILATNGREAIEKCKQHPEINLVLMDLKLPEMSGFEATRQIKAMRTNLPVIAITAFAMSGDESKAMEAGCDDYISKPVSKEMLFKKIEKMGL